MDGLHQLHIFIFFLAVFHVIYSAITMTLGRAKVCVDLGAQTSWLFILSFYKIRAFYLLCQIKGWKEWEQDHLIDEDALNGTAMTYK